MKHLPFSNRIAIVTALLVNTLPLLAQVKYVPLKPMSQVVSTSLKSVRTSGAITLTHYYLGRRYRNGLC